MKNMSFGSQNELQAHSQRELANDADRAGAMVALVTLFIVAAYGLAFYLDQVGVFQ